jgi:hypothetical protein
VFTAGSAAVMSHCAEADADIVTLDTRLNHATAAWRGDRHLAMRHLAGADAAGSVGAAADRGADAACRGVPIRVVG